MNMPKLFLYVMQCFGELKWIGVNLHYYCCEKPVADGIGIFMGTLLCSNAKTIGLRIQPGMSKPLCLSGQRRWARSDCSAALVIIRRPRRAFRSVKPPQLSEMRKYGPVYSLITPYFSLAHQRNI